MTEEKHRRWRFNPEVSLGTLLEIFLVILPAVIYIVRLDARQSATEKNVQALIVQDEKKTESISLLSKNQAVLAALFDAHTAEQKKIARTP